ncbi:DegT/DnrJ/EryC1/StrS family aminotransferase [Cesiribacter andamanensis]|uniref:UDP-4-amino-4-deoxy-L-arabinose--oxoglutarate aminotransferase n=1 Tax=Cesiribacter andamanensis AMV16 TaxID=1279009 RepID=M7NPR5_9BACT|nr:DegT/DnrJ/EryC1/StrS family aminotransferase [Cesiribacter andamanensis]EMR03705.1 UDP-4-amino-4-deoxy-L-arabinose--oxoglutarate aminotransferase [Cesiribacter andamanensis AMV16]
MHIPFVDLHAQYLSIQAEIDRAIRQVLEGGQFIGGRWLEEFSEAFARLHGVRHCIPVANGTDALYISLKMLGIGPGDEVITPALSWISSASCISQCGATPVFADCEPGYYTLDPARLEALITPRTRALIPVHLYGQPADMDPILEIARRHQLLVLEDCAQAHLSRYKGQLCGTMGHAAAFSFYPTKNLGALGDAGCILTNDAALAEKCRLFANMGGVKTHQIEGINSRMDTLQAAILLTKLPHLPRWTESRIRLSQRYSELLAGSGLQLPPVREGCTHTYHLYVVRSRQRDALKAYLESKGIGTALHYPSLLPLLPAYAHLRHTPEEYPVAAGYQQDLLSLPLYPELTKQEIVYIAETIIEFLT